MATQAAQIQVRRDTAANWTSENPTLASGEIGFETDTNKLKIGDGATAWNAPLAYFGGGGGTPGGADTNVQYNDGGAFGGDANLTWDKDNKILTLSYNNGEMSLATIQGEADGYSAGLQIFGGNASTADLPGGDLQLRGGLGDGSGIGGSLQLNGGQGGATGGGGVFQLYGGAGGATSGDGGEIKIYGGNASTDGNGANATIRGGAGANNGNGGNVVLLPGAGAGTGTIGVAKIVDVVSSNSVLLDTTDLSADRTFTFPDADGKFALTSQFEFPFVFYTATLPLTADGYPHIMTVGLPFTATSFVCAVNCTANNGASNYWTINIQDLAGNTICVLDTKTAVAANTWYRLTTTTFTNTDMTTTRKGAYAYCVKTGTPGNLYLAEPKLLGTLV